MSPVFTISDEEFRVGLFQDIERAIQHPGTAEEKGGTYVLHQNYDTSGRINAYLKRTSGRHVLRRTVSAAAGSLS